MTVWPDDGRTTEETEGGSANTSCPFVPRSHEKRASLARITAVPNGGATRPGPGRKAPGTAGQGFLANLAACAQARR